VARSYALWCGVLDIGIAAGMLATAAAVTAATVVALWRGLTAQTPVVQLPRARELRADGGDRPPG
jgi:hypothetical protein